MLKMDCLRCQRETHVTGREVVAHCPVKYQHVHCTVCGTPIAWNEQPVARWIRAC